MRTPPYNTPYRGPDHKVRCAECGIGVLRSRTVFMLVDAPGYPRQRMLVHPECWNKPQPRALRPIPPPVVAPDVIQYPSVTETASVSTPVLSSVSAVTGGASQSATLTGTGFTAYCRARVNGQTRPTTYGSGTSLSMTVYAADAVSGTNINVDVQTLRVPNGTTETPAAILAAQFSNKVAVAVS